MSTTPTSASAHEEAARVPKYWELKGHLLELIQRKGPGSVLPAERALAQEFGVSRTTVRQSLHELVLEGRLERIHGSGTFVSRPKVMQSLRLTSYTEDMLTQGLAPSARVLALDAAPADETMSMRLR